MHWHTFYWLGDRRPSDAEARDLTRATPPNELAHWFRKPVSMRRKTYRDPEGVLDWLGAEMAAQPPLGLPTEVWLAGARKNLMLGQNAYVGYYTPSGWALVCTAMVCSCDQA